MIKISEQIREEEIFNVIFQLFQQTVLFN